MVSSSAPYKGTPLDDERVPALSSSAQLYERALTLAAMDFHEEAIKALRTVTLRLPDHELASRKLRELLRLAGEESEVSTAGSGAAVGVRLHGPYRNEIANIEISERALREQMREIAHPTDQLRALRNQLLENDADVTAMRLLARLEWQGGNLIVARLLFERALSLAPAYEGARADLAQLLALLREDTLAAEEAKRLVTFAPTNVTYRALYADALRSLGDLESSILIMQDLIRDEPANTRCRCVYAQALRVAGRREESANEFRICLALQPGMGEAYWGLAELRGNFITADDIVIMRECLLDTRHETAGRMLLHNALGHALEYIGDFSGSFAAYEAAAALSLTMAAERGEFYNSAKDEDQVRRRCAVFTAHLISKLPASSFRPDCTPIFVLGMPRAGSTLVEQILASHSLVEATMELPVLGNIVRDLSLSRRLVMPDAYPECVSRLSRTELSQLGEKYLEQAAAYRKTQSPYFVDKRPWNWLDVGLIRMILPHAKIVDVRREPMAACFAMYKHMLANDAPFPYGFTNLANYYTQYAHMMTHYRGVMPGHIHLLSYERLVEDTETEIRRLLEYCGLPFEPGCLRFWETERAVATPSSEQVRRPIFRDALHQWRNFEPWLHPLKEALEEASIAAAALPQPLSYDCALTLAAMSVYEDAIEQLQATIAHQPTHPGAWRKLAELLRLAGKDRAAEQAKVAAARFVTEAPKWRHTLDPRTQGQLYAAEAMLTEQFSGKARAAQVNILREKLRQYPADAAATHLLSRLEWQDGDQATSMSLLERTLDISPNFFDARAELATALMHTGHFVRALEQIKILLRAAPESETYRAIYSDALRSVGDIEGALTVAEQLLREYPRNPGFWYGYGMLMQYIGKRDESAAAFRNCLEILPTMGEAYSGLADLKTGALTEVDVAAMRGLLEDPTLESSSRMYLYYALAHALERTGDFSGSFSAYQKGARLFRGFFLSRGEAYNEEEFVKRVQGLKRVYTARNLVKHAASQTAAIGGTPIFVVGMPRAGSTLVEQILASHSQVEATRELPIINNLIQELMLSRRIAMPNAYPECVMELGAAKLAELGERYLRDALSYRHTDRPYFIDKRPLNWLEAGFIHLILPQAKIIDIRREPMAACFAVFKQVLTDGSDYSYDLHDLGRRYTEYVSMMDHWKSVMPGGIHFIQYERLVEETDSEIRRMLDYCGLPFEVGCLTFWQTKRAVATPSAEQVRRPIFRDALHQWRNFEPWLGPLKKALSQPARS